MIDLSWSIARAALHRAIKRRVSGESNRHKGAGSSPTEGRAQSSRGHALAHGRATAPLRCLRSKPAAVLAAAEECFHHFGRDKISLELVQLSEPEIETVEVAV